MKTLHCSYIHTETSTMKSTTMSAHDPQRNVITITRYSLRSTTRSNDIAEYVEPPTTLLGTVSVVLTLLCMPRTSVAPKLKMLYMLGAAYSGLTLLVMQVFFYLSYCTAYFYSNGADYFYFDIFRHSRASCGNTRNLRSMAQERSLPCNWHSSA